MNSHSKRRSWTNDQHSCPSNTEQVVRVRQQNMIIVFQIPQNDNGIRMPLHQGKIGLQQQTLARRVIPESEGLREKAVSPVEGATAMCDPASLVRRIHDGHKPMISILPPCNISTALLSHSFGTTGWMMTCLGSFSSMVFHA